MYGAGNIGRGFIGQLFSESGFEVVFIDVNSEIMDKLNEDRQYPIRILNGGDSREVIVTHVRGVYGYDFQRIAEEIAGADIMATAVGVNVLPAIAKPIAEGLKMRWQNGRMDPLNIIVCENLLDVDHYLAGLINQALDDDGKANFDQLIGLVEASIGRMVPLMSPDLFGDNILRICVEEYDELPVDKDGFKGKIPHIKNMLPISPFTFCIQRKLFIHNMGHALTAYLGKLKGYRYIWEAISDPAIQLIVLKAMLDSAVALSREHAVELDKIFEHVDDLLFRFGNKQLGDTVNRVGNDTKRKLAENDRLIGAARLCAKHGILPVEICLGIAAAMKFDSFIGMPDSEVGNLLATEGPAAILSRFCGLSADEPIRHLILQVYELMNDGADLTMITETAIELKKRNQRRMSTAGI